MTCEKNTAKKKLLLTMVLMLGILVVNQTPATWNPFAQNVRAQSVPAPPEPPQDPPQDTVRLHEQPDEPGAVRLIEQPVDSPEQSPSPSPTKPSSTRPSSTKAHPATTRSRIQNASAAMDMAILENGTLQVQLKNPSAIILTIPNGETTITRENGEVIRIGNILQLSPAAIQDLSVSPAISQMLVFIRGMLPVQQTIAGSAVPPEPTPVAVSSSGGPAPEPTKPPSAVWSSNSMGATGSITTPILANDSFRGFLQRIWLWVFVTTHSPPTQTTQ